MSEDDRLPNATEDMDAPTPLLQRLPVREDLTGTTLSHFKVERKLGEGGMGLVYLALDERLGRRVALKVLPEEIRNDERKTRRFLREARAAAAVSHANIAGIYEIDEADGVVFIAMELIKGDSLRAIVRSGGLPAGEVRRIGTQAARGLGAAHEGGVVHRDIKPDNVMRSPAGDIKILDFGLARPPKMEGVADAGVTQTIEGQVSGTPAYMSPEQASGKKLGPTTDVFSMGVTLYELLTGRLPFEAESVVDFLLAIMKEDPLPIESEADTELVSVIMRCLEKDPQRRFADGTELALALGGKPSEATVSAMDIVSPSSVPSANQPAAPGSLPIDAATLSTTSQGLAAVELEGAGPRRSPRAGAIVVTILLLAALALVAIAKPTALFGTELPPSLASIPVVSHDPLIQAQMQKAVLSLYAIEDDSLRGSAASLLEALPDEPHVRLIAALAKGSSGDTTALISDLRKLSEREGLAPDVRELLEVSLVAGVDPAISEADYQEKVAGFVAAHPEDYFGRLVIGYLAANATRPTAAWRDMSALVELDPTQPAAFLTMGTSFLAAGRTQDWSDAIKAGLVHHPNSLALRKTRADDLMRLGELEAARQELEWVLTRKPDFGTAYASLMDIHVLRGNKSAEREVAERVASGLLPASEVVATLLQHQQNLHAHGWWQRVDEVTKTVLSLLEGPKHTPLRFNYVYSMGSLELKSRRPDRMTVWIEHIKEAMTQAGVDPQVHRWGMYLHWLLSATRAVYRNDAPALEEAIAQLEAHRRNLPPGSLDNLLRSLNQSRGYLNGIVLKAEGYRSEKAKLEAPGVAMTRYEQLTHLGRLARLNGKNSEATAYYSEARNLVSQCLRESFSMCRRDLTFALLDLARIEAEAKDLDEVSAIAETQRKLWPFADADHPVLAQFAELRGGT